MNSEYSFFIDKIGEVSVPEVDVSIHQIEDNYYNILHEGKNYKAYIKHFDLSSKKFTISIDGMDYKGIAKDELDLLIDKLGFGNAGTQSVKEQKAPMPGLVLDIMVNEGDAITVGTNLLILEAMKMENIIKSSGDAVVKKICVSKGDKVNKNQVLIEYE